LHIHAYKIEKKVGSGPFDVACRCCRHSWHWWHYLPWPSEVSSKITDH